MSVDPALLGRLEIETSDAMEQLGFRMGERLEAGDLLILTGPLGAGKTTFTRGLAEGLGVRGPVQSPTFVIARTHPSLVGRAPWCMWTPTVSARVPSSTTSISTSHDRWS